MDMFKWVVMLTLAVGLLGCKHTDMHTPKPAKQKVETVTEAPNPPTETVTFINTGPTPNFQ